MDGVSKLRMMGALACTLYIATTPVAPAGTGTLARFGEMVLLPGGTIRLQLESVAGEAAPAAHLPLPPGDSLTITWTVVDDRPALRVVSNYDSGVGFYARTCSSSAHCHPGRFISLASAGERLFFIPGDTRSMVLGKTRKLRVAEPPKAPVLPYYKQWIPWIL